MNNVKVAAALNTISLAFGELAEALSEAPQAPRTAQDDPGGSRLEKWAVTQEPSPFVDIPEQVFAPRATEQGSLAQCPSHKARYMAGKYGPYCPAKSDDPAWANKKGYCTITPENAAEWLRITAA